ncbi:hypothetical protein BGY98DRAFT_1040189, partial [Russula aff. rugulosa BPL654]
MGHPRPRSTRSTSWCLAAALDIWLDSWTIFSWTWRTWSHNVCFVRPFVDWDYIWLLFCVPPSILYEFLCSIWVTVVEDTLIELVVRLCIPASHYYNYYVDED